MSRKSSTSASQTILIILITSCAKTICCTPEDPNWCPSGYEHRQSLAGDERQCIKLVLDEGNVTQTLKKCGHNARHFEPRTIESLEALKEYAREKRVTLYNVWIGAKRSENYEWRWMSDGSLVGDYLIPEVQRLMECYFVTTLKSEHDDCCVSLLENNVTVHECRRNSAYPLCTLTMNPSTCLDSSTSTVSTTLETTISPQTIALEHQIGDLQRILHHYDPSRKVEAALTLASISIVFQCLTIVAIIGYIFYKKKAKEERTAYFSHHNKGMDQEKEENKSPTVVPTCNCFKC